MAYSVECFTKIKQSNSYLARFSSSLTVQATYPVIYSFYELGLAWQSLSETMLFAVQNVSVSQEFVDMWGAYVLHEFTG